MSRTKQGTVELLPDQRRLVLGVAIAQVALLSISSSLNYVLPGMVAEFNASEEQSQLLRQVSSLAALLVVFLAGVLGERLGERRVMLFSSGLFVLGSAIVTIAPSMVLVTIGLLIANVGKAVISVVLLALLAAKIQDPDGRATAFASISAAVPIVYLVMPLVAGSLAASAGWRWVTALWILFGIAAFLALRFLTPKDGASKATGEMWTPALAGVILATGVQFISDIRGEGWTTTTVSYLVLGGLAAIALVVIYRREANPSLSLEPLRRGGLMVLFVVIILFSFANLYYYSTLLFQIVYGYSELGAAVAMIPAQLGSIAGAIVARKLIQRRGITLAGTAMILVMGASLLLAFTMQPDFPIVAPIAFVTIYAVASVAAYVALTNAVMNLAERGREGEVSSYRSAASNIGAAVGVAVMTSIVSVVGLQSMQTQMSDSGISSSQADEAAWAVLDGESNADVSSQYGISDAEVTQISEMEQIAFVQSYRAQALAGAAICLISGGIFYVARRRNERGEADAVPA